jgi:NADH-quinone oxidoreductase subunit C
VAWEPKDEVNPLSSTGETTAEAPAPVVDEGRDALVAQMRDSLGDAVVGSHVKPGDDVWVRVTAESWVAAVKAARDKLGMDFFDFLSAIDWMPSPYGRGEEDPTAEPVERSTDVVQGYAGGETRFQLICRLQTTTGKAGGITLKTDVPESMTVDTISPVFAGANWHERETWEMFGITFTGHPDLRHMYLPIDFEGYPLRKDFPLLARMVKPWPGIVDVEPIPAEFDTDGGEEA